MTKTKRLSAAFLFLTVLGLGWVSSSAGTEASLPPAHAGTDSGREMFMPRVSRADSLVLQPGSEGKDAWVDASAPDANHGDSEWFYGMGILSSRAAFIEFDLSSMPAGSTVLSAKITLWAEYRDGLIYFEPVASAWNEMSITWANQPSTLPPQVSHPISRGEPGDPCYWGCSWPFDITSIVQYWASDPQLNFGLRVAADTGSIGWLMASSDNIAYPRPRLTVLYTGPVAVEATTWGKTKALYR